MSAIIDEIHHTGVVLSLMMVLSSRGEVKRTKEELFASLEVTRSQGGPLSIRYYLLEEARKGGETLYGIKVAEETTGNGAIAPGITRDKNQISALMTRLVREAVTPTGLADVLSDLMY